jgi:hypothetical protein
MSGYIHCWFCRHYRNDRPATCSAFPKGIPEQIWQGRDEHRQPVEGDRGIQFELNKADRPGFWGGRGQ